MKAFTTLGEGIDGLKLNEFPIPEPESNQILVKITAASLNYRDLLVVKGIESWKPITPRIPLSDGVGKIIATGANVTGGKPATAWLVCFYPDGWTMS